MNREGTTYEIAHFLAVVGFAYLALFLARFVGVTALWAELVIAGVVNVSYVLVVFALDLALPSWRGVIICTLLVYIDGRNLVYV